MSMGDGKAENVLEYLDNLVEKGKATGGAVRPLKTAFAKVLQIVDGENWRVTDVRSIDVEDYMSRFANLTMGKYSSGSLIEYKSRVNKVTAWYINFLNNPGWAPSVQKRNRTAKAPSDKLTSKPTDQPAKPPSHHEPPQAMPVVASAPGRVLYPYPLLDGQLIHISLPIKLSKDDAKRIAAFIESIAVEFPAGGQSNG